MQDPQIDLVITPNRSPRGFTHKKIKEMVIDFDQLSSCSSLFDDVDSVFCTLGTTIKKAQSKESFKKIDYEYPLTIGKLVQAKKIPQYLIVTAVGSNKNSVFFYNQVKGQLEADLDQLTLNSLQIFRPSLLLGPRKDTRFLEQFAQIILPCLAGLLIGPLAIYKPIKAELVAKKMHKMSKLNKTGTIVYQGKDLFT